MTAGAAGRPVASVRTLMRGIIDYAGLFPPASLTMAAAVATYAEHRTGAEAWILGRFVVPAGRLDEFETAAASVLPREGAFSWALSALVSGDLEEDLQRIERFNDRHADARSGAVHIDTVELKTNSARDVARAGELLDRRFDTYMEVPIADDPSELIAAIAKTMAKAKVRTGGVTADAFPTSEHLTRFLGRCVEHDVAFKATAGLHHAWRGEYALTYAPGATQGTMFGFLNLLISVAAIRDGMGGADASSVREERDPRLIQFTENSVIMRNRELAMSTVVKARESMTSFGSCSFSEPVAELRAMALL